MPAPVAAGSPESDLRKVAAGLDKLQRGDPKVADLFSEGVRIVSSPARPAIDDELAFLVAAGNTGKFPEDAKRFEGLLSLFLRKPRQADVEQARILRYVAEDYKLYLGDRKKERELLLQAEKLHEKAQIDQAKYQVETWLELGNTHIADRAKALAYFKKVLDFPLYDEPYKQEKRFKELYAEGAVQTVKLTDNASLGKLRLHPVGRAAVARLMPRHAQMLNSQLPKVAEIRAIVARWLEAISVDEKMNAELCGHIEAIRKFIRDTDR